MYRRLGGESNREIVSFRSHVRTRGGLIEVRSVKNVWFALFPFPFWLGRFSLFPFGSGGFPFSLLGEGYPSFPTDSLSALAHLMEKEY